MQLKDRLKSLRIEAGFTKADLARAIGVSDVVIGYWESGQVRTVTSENLLRLAKVYDCTASDILGDARSCKCTHSKTATVNMGGHKRLKGAALDEALLKVNYLCPSDRGL